MNGEIFDTILETKILTEKWREHYNKIRPHSSLNFSPPVPEVKLPLQVANLPAEGRCLRVRLSLTLVHLMGAVIPLKVNN